MKKEFTKNELLSRRGCFSRDKVNNLKCVKENKMNLEGISKDISLEDLLFFIASKCELSIKEEIEFVVYFLNSLKFDEDDTIVVKSLMEAIKLNNPRLIIKDSTHPYILPTIIIVDNYLKKGIHPLNPFTSIQLALKDIKVESSSFKNKIKKSLINFIK